MFKKEKDKPWSFKFNFSGWRRCCPKKTGALNHVFKIFLIWQIGLILLGVLAPLSGIPRRENYNYSELKVFNPPFFWNRANFDGIHYLDIARKGYGIYQQAFFPLYPKLIRFLTPIFLGRDLLAALFISCFSLIIALWLFYKLILLDYKKEVAGKALLFFLIFPTSFFLGMVYTESLFLLFILGCFYAARKEKWFLAGVSGALAANTRLVGVFLFPALLFEWWQQRKEQESVLPAGEQAKRLLSVFFIPFGLFSYMKFLTQNYRDPLMFFHVQPFFGAERSGGKVILLYQVFWRYFKMILTTTSDPLYFTVWLELLAGGGFLLLLWLAYRKEIRYSYLIFAFLAYLVPAFSGTFSSMPRYLLATFPSFIALSLIKRPKLQKSILFVFGILLIISAVFFFQGYWIS